MKRMVMLWTVLALLMLPQPATAFSGSGLAYAITGTDVTVYGYTGNAKSLVIPEQIEGLPVAAIEELAFWGQQNLTDVFISPGVQRIGAGAFCECSSLQWAVVPPTVTEISDGTFQGCTSLRWFAVPRSIRRIGDYAFNLCRNLPDMQIPGTVHEIGRYALHGCSSLTSVEIGEGTRQIGTGAFASCPALVHVALPASLEVLAPDVFAGSSPQIDFAGSRSHWHALTSGLEGYDSLDVRCADDDPPLLWTLPGSGFQLENGLLRGIGIGRPGSYTSLAELAAGLGAMPGCLIEIHVPLSSPAEAAAPVTTGTGIRAVAGDKSDAATVIIMGDVCETGLMSIAQVVRLAGMLGEQTDGQPARLAGDFNRNGRLDIGDLRAETALLCQGGS